jgi:Transcription factor WhiB
VTAATRSKETARARILECLAASPGLTAQQVGRALGLRSNAMRQLKAMLYDAEVIAVPQYRPQMGRTVATWRIAPPGTVPPPRPEPDQAGLARRRARDTAARRELRAKAKGIPAAPFSSLRGAPVPTRRLSDPACAGADPALFFPPPEYETPSARRRRVRQAAAFCDACPARRACYQGAAERCEPWGVWGGVDFTPQVGGRFKAS